MSTPDLDQVVETVRESMWLPDPGIIEITLATIVANRAWSPPLWMLLVGPPSSGKTEALELATGLSDVSTLSTITEAGLLSGSPGDGGTGGALFEIHPRGILLASDFGTLLNEHSGTRGRVFACLREVYDGKFTRKLGTTGGKSFGWTGHAGFLGACTEAIDGRQVDLGILGERFTYFRLPETTPSDEYMTCVVTDEQRGHLDDIRTHRSEVVTAYLDGLTLPGDLPEPKDGDQERLITLAGLAAKCRSSVERDGYTRDIELVPGHERSTRLYRQLRHLHAALEVMGTPPQEAWRLAEKSALDSVHPMRMAAIQWLVGHGSAHASGTIAANLRLPETTVRRHLDDLRALGVLDLQGDRPGLWAPSAWLRDAWRDAGLRY